MIFFATSNLHKFQEAKEIFRIHGIEIKQVNVRYTELQSDKLENIVKYGCDYSVNITKGPTIVEDSGLFIEALNGFPGPYSSYVFKKIGNKGLLKLLNGVQNRSAKFKSVIGYCKTGEKVITFAGKVRGKIANEVKGKFGFGFDPIFIPKDGDGRTFGEMQLKEKNKLSHRRKAIENFLKWYLVQKNGKTASKKKR